MKKFTSVPFILAIFFATALLLKKRDNKTQIEIGLASIKNSNITVYHGPSKRAPAAWKLLHKNWPIYILEITNNWAKITDAYNTTGWIEKKHIGRPYALITEKTHAFLENEKNYDAILLKNSSVKFCKENAKFCEIEIENKRYLIDCKKLWYNIR